MLSTAGVVSSVVGLTLGAVGMVGAASGMDVLPTEPKVTICHATSSEEDPYNMIAVGRSAVDGAAGGHREHADDIIPPSDGITALNWPEGEATFNDNCGVPEDEATAEPKVTICHATNSETNPYNMITVAQSAVANGGHRGHTGPVWYPGAKDAGVRWGDIIPPTDGVTAANWPAGESIFNNGCEAGVPKVKNEAGKSTTTTSP